MPRGRPGNVLRPVKLTTWLPEDIRAKMDLHLYSEVEGRVPHGAYSKFLSERVREFFEPKTDAPLKLAGLKRFIEQVEFYTWNDNQQEALRAFRDRLLEMFE